MSPHTASDGDDDDGDDDEVDVLCPPQTPSARCRKTTPGRLR